MIRQVSYFAIAFAIIFPNAASAQLSPPAAKLVLSRACLGKENQSVSTDRIAEAMIIETGRLPSDMINANERLTDLIWKLSDPDALNPSDLNKQFAGGVQSLEQTLFNAVGKKVARVDGVPAGKFRWLFNPALEWKLQCPGEPEPQTPLVDSLDTETVYPNIVLRGSVADLTDTGKARLKSSSLKAVVTRERTTLADNSTKTDTNLSIGGTLGLRLTSKNDVSNVVHAYTSYSLARNRTRPRPVLAAGVKENDGDTHSLELGVAGKFELTSNEAVTKIFARTKASYLHDFIHKSDIGRLGISLVPGVSEDLGFCRLGSFKLLAKGLYSRCGGEVELEAAHIFKSGTSEFSATKDYVALGINGKIELFSPTFKDDGIFAGAAVRYLPVIHGKLSDIFRYDLKVGYRIWSDAKVGFDVGLNYSKGTNEKSFESDDKLAVEFGVIF